MELTWRYNHTGGLPLTGLSVSYTTIESDGSDIGASSRVVVSNVDASSVAVSNLEAGYGYVFNITAENGNGYSSILCGPTFHNTGKSKSECSYRHVDNVRE